jgi:hypothetical protein
VRSRAGIEFWKRLRTQSPKKVPRRSGGTVTKTAKRKRNLGATDIAIEDTEAEALPKTGNETAKSGEDDIDQGHQESTETKTVTDHHIENAQDRLTDLERIRLQPLRKIPMVLLRHQNQTTIPTLSNP